MSNHHAVEDVEPWDPPPTFRQWLVDTERVADMLVDQVSDQLLVPAAEVDFLARRLRWLARAAHQALPPEID